MRPIPTVLVQESLKLEPAGAFLFVLEVAVNPAQAIYLVNNQESIVFDGKTYEPFPFVFNVSYDENTGNVAEASVTVPNVAQFLTPYFMKNGGLRDATLTIRQLHTAHLADPAAHESTSFVVRNSAVNENALTFNLGGQNLLQQRVPFDKFRRGFCSLTYNFPGQSNDWIEITGATNASPIVVTTAEPHLLLSGYRAYVRNVGGNTAANGSWLVEYLTSLTFRLVGSTGSGAYTSGGTLFRASGPKCGYDGNVLNVTGATNASPIVISTANAHGIADGQTVVVASVGGNTAANGTWQVLRVNANQVSLTGSTGSGAYTSGGTMSYRLPTCDRSLLGVNGCLIHQNTTRARIQWGILRF